MNYPGFEYSDDGTQCLRKIYTWLFQRFYCDDVYLFEECRGPTYGYGCNASCQCVHGTCNPNATNVNQSCTCNTGYQLPFCIQLIDTCGKNI
jgi:hypothetical protein